MTVANSKVVRLVTNWLSFCDEAVIARREFRRERVIFGEHAEAARRSALTPRQRAYEDWSRAWYGSNRDEETDKDSWLRAFDAAAREWNERNSPLPAPSEVSFVRAGQLTLRVFKQAGC